MLLLEAVPPRASTEKSSWNEDPILGEPTVKNLTLSTPSPLPQTHPFRKATELGCRWGESTTRCSFHSRIPLNSISWPQYKVIAGGRRRAFSVLSPPSPTPKQSVGVASPPGGHVEPLHHSPVARERRDAAEGFGLRLSLPLAAGAPDWDWG